jgi:hypothetical protein
MIITSSQQLEELYNPSEKLDIDEFDELTLKVGSFICISKRKKINFLNLLKLIIDDKKTQKIYFSILGEDNLHLILKAYLNSTPNCYKKIFRSKLNKNAKNNRNAEKNI